MKPTTPSRAIYALIGDEEQNGKQKKNKNKETGSGSQPSYLNHLVASYDPHGSHTGNENNNGNDDDVLIFRLLELQI